MADLGYHFGIRADFACLKDKILFCDFDLDLESDILLLTFFRFDLKTYLCNISRDPCSLSLNLTFFYKYCYSIEPVDP